ncbi:hypothetical protein acdb102_38210 [Acidothermaceae bacterium B102]|nr:hypothetical protein acdb102_38210 [Acidothermaceae bacterium B102]
MSLPPPPPDPTDEPAAPAGRWRTDVVTAALIIVVLEVVALPLGLLWGHLAPHPLYYPSGHQLNLVVGDAKPLVRADGLFLLITGVAGLVSGCTAFVVARRSDIGATIGLALGGLAAGWLAWHVGHAWTGGLQPLQLALKPDDTKAKLAADLGARVVVVSWGVAAVAMHGILYAVTWPAKPKPEPVPAAVGASWTDSQTGPVAEAS